MRTEHLVPGTKNVWRPGSPSHEETDATLKQYLWFLERAHNTALHGPGVADGLTVEAAAGTRMVRVTPGVAIDRDGRHIVLAPGGKAELRGTPDLPSDLRDVTEAGVELSTEGHSGQRNVVVQWRESFAKDLHDQDSAVFRIRHTPWLRLLPPGPDAVPDPDDPPEMRVLLAVITVANDGTVAAGGVAAGERATSGLGAGAVRLIGSAAASAASSVVAQATAATVSARPGNGLDVRLPGSSAPALVVDSGGRVGIGVGSPADRLHVAGSIRADAGLTVAGNTTITGPVRVAAGTTLDKDLTVTGPVRVAAGTTLDKDLTVAGATTLAGAATVAGATTLRGQVTAESAATVAGTLRVNKATTLDRELTVGGPASLAGNLTVGGPTSLAGNLTASGATTLAGTVRVNGGTTLDKDLTVAGTTTLAGAATVAGATTLRGQVTAESTATVAGTLRVSKATTLDKELTVGGATKLASSLNVTGGVAAGGLSVSGSASVAGGLSVNGGVTAGGLNVSGGVTAGGWLSGNSGASFAGNLFGNGGIWLRNADNKDTIVLDGASGRMWVNGPTDWRQLGGNAARFVRSVWLFARPGSTAVADVDLGATRQVFAFVSMTCCDPTDPVEQSDALAMDIFAVDGAATGGWITGGQHWGGAGEPTNVRAQAFNGSARTITFRARSMQNQSLMGIGVVFYE
jgi:cytoskeletal protein CcmA (bactofilin family)